MSTTLTFKGVAFQGVVVSAPEGELSGAVDRSGVAGLNGVDEILMGRRGMPIRVDVLLKNFATDATLIAYVANTLKPLLNKNGTLALSGGLTRTYAETTLDWMEPVDRATSQDQDSSMRRIQTWRFSFHCLNP